MNKLISIMDYIRVPYRTSTLQCPVTKISLNDGELERIFSTAIGILHVCAHNPSNTSEIVFLTKENYMLTTEELFNIPVETKVEEPVIETPVVETTIDEVVAEEPAEVIDTVVETVPVEEPVEVPETEIVTEEIPVVETVDEEPVEIKAEEAIEEQKAEPSVEDIAAAFKKTPASAKKKVNKTATSKKKN